MVIMLISVGAKTFISYKYRAKINLFHRSIKNFIYRTSCFHKSYTFFNSAQYRSSENRFWARRAIPCVSTLSLDITETIAEAKFFLISHAEQHTIALTYQFRYSTDFGSDNRRSHTQRLYHITDYFHTKWKELPSSAHVSPIVLSP